MTNLLDAYYLFERVAKKSSTRMDCTACTANYEPFENKRATRSNKETEKRDATNVGSLKCYYVSVPDAFSGDAQRRADKSLTMGSKNLSSIFVPDVTKPMAYGDVANTNDALLFIFTDMATPNGIIAPNSKLEIFVAKGQRNNARALYNLLADGELAEEIEQLRARARGEIVEVKIEQKLY